MNLSHLIILRAAPHPSHFLALPEPTNHSLENAHENAKPISAPPVHHAIKMGKKSRATTEPNPGMVPSRDVMNRLNFLYQASILFASSAQQQSRSSEVQRKGKGRDTASDQREKEERGDELGEEERKEFLIPTQAGTAREALEDTGGDAAMQVGSSSAPQKQNEGMERQRRRKPSNKESTALPALSRMMIQTLKDVSTRATVRMYVAPSRSIVSNRN